MGRFMLYASLFASAACAAPPREAVSTPRSMSMRKPPSPPPATAADDNTLQAIDALPVPDGAVNYVVFPDMGYQVRLPRGWGYATDVRPDNGDAFDLVLSHEATMTSASIATYWDSEERKATLDGVMGLHQFRMERGGNKVSEETYDANAVGYVIEFTARRELSGMTMVFRVVGIRLHSIPAPVFVIFGISPQNNLRFMSKSVDEVIAGIEPYAESER